MSGFAELGLTTGRALPAPFAASASNGQMFGANGTWKYPPGYLLAVDAGGAGTPLNTTGETTVLNSTMAGGIPAFAAIGDAVQLRCWGIAVFGGTGTLTLNVYAGATKIAAGSASGSYTLNSTRGWVIDVWIHLLSSTTVAVSGYMIPRTTSSAGFQSIAVADFMLPGNDFGSAVTVSTLPLAIDVKAITSISTATTQVTCKGAEARYFPKNY